MPPHKKQHYVPKNYLRRFSNDGLIFFGYSAKTDKFLSNIEIESQCQKDYIYGKDNSLEIQLGQIENNFFHFLNGLENKSLEQNHQFSEQDFFSIVAMTSLQYFRTLDSIKKTKQIVKIRTSRRKNQNKIDNSSLLNIMEGIESGTLLLDLDYKIIQNKTNFNFITSDNPVVLTNPLLESFKVEPPIRFISIGALILFPISSKNLILIYDQSIYTFKCEGKIINCDSLLDINQINGAQISHCNNCIYFENNSDQVNIEGIKSEYVSKRKSSNSKERDLLKKTNLKLILSKPQLDLNLSFIYIESNILKRVEENILNSHKATDLIRNKALYKYKTIDQRKKFLSES